LALASLQRTIARSRSRISWLSEGDANTALFHQHAFVSMMLSVSQKFLDISFLQCCRETQSMLLPSLHLFFPIIEKVYLFRGVSFTCMLQLV